MVTYHCKNVSGSISQVWRCWVCCACCFTDAESEVLEQNCNVLQSHDICLDCPQRCRLYFNNTLGIILPLQKYYSPYSRPCVSCTELINQPLSLSIHVVKLAYKQFIRVLCTPLSFTKPCYTVLNAPPPVPVLSQGSPTFLCVSRKAASEIRYSSPALLWLWGYLYIPLQLSQGCGPRKDSLFTAYCWAFPHLPPDATWNKGADTSTSGWWEAGQGSAYLTNLFHDHTSPSVSPPPVPPFLAASLITLVMLALLI